MLYPPELQGQEVADNTLVIITHNRHQSKNHLTATDTADLDKNLCYYSRTCIVVEEAGNFNEDISSLSHARSEQGVSVKDIEPGQQHSIPANHEKGFALLPEPKRNDNDQAH